MSKGITRRSTRCPRPVGSGSLASLGAGERGRSLISGPHAVWFTSRLSGNRYGVLMSWVGSSAKK